jgi:hypothetical protein
MLCQALRAVWREFIFDASSDSKLSVKLAIAISITSIGWINFITMLFNRFFSAMEQAFSTIFCFD